MSKIKKVVLVVASVLLVAVSGFMAATWAPDRPVELLKARWAPPPSTFVNVQGMSVHVRDEGPREDPTPIVLLHGTSASLHTWEGWASALRDKHRVIRLDLPGFGLTGPHPEDRYDGETYTSFMRAMLDQLGVNACVLAGNSFGGYIAWKTAIADSRVRKLVLVDAGGYPNPNAQMPLGFKLAKMPVVNLIVPYSLPRSVVEKSLRNVYGDPSKVTPELIDLYYDLAVRQGNRAALVKRFEQATYDAVDQTKRIAIPTLILWGGRDRLVAPEFADKFHNDIPNSKLVRFDSLGHIPHEEDPRATITPVLTFIEGP
ncbi:MAG TPA: alpha/beta hydrolase [Polyangium sp.]|nr:alpha/beta hydrolase [Polyangium sp.]